MPKFQKKPVVIEAVQYDGTDECARRIGLEITVTETGIQTLEGFMRASPGDWIITGVKGERYPCKPDVFEATYGPVTPAPAPDLAFGPPSNAGVRFAPTVAPASYSLRNRRGSAWVWTCPDGESGYHDTEAEAIAAANAHNRARLAGVK